MSRSKLADARLVVCVDGPMTGEWFHEDEWRDRVRAAARMRDEFKQPPAACLGYTPAYSMADPVPHPRLKSISGHGLYFRDVSRSQPAPPTSSGATT